MTNPNATAMSPRTRDVILRALGRELKVDVAETTGRGHAADLAAEARADRFDLVIAVGGDGTVNEIVDGLLRDGVAPDLPRLAVVPGGSANVFARALGLPAEPIEATGVVLERLRSGHERRIGLGLIEADGLRRCFTFSAGFGLDAEIVREVERRREKGARSTPGLYMRSGLRQFAATDRRHPALTVEPSTGEPIARVFMAIVTNTTPWTYFGARALQPTPEATFETGLDAFLLHRLGALGTANKLRRLLTGGAPGGHHATSLHDESALTIRSSRPVGVEVDGDYLGEYTLLRLTAIPEAIAVIT
ncbi:MAG: diacylglycerol/lipid kinase family protein [Acidothermaceae bacterium]